MWFKEDRPLMRDARMFVLPSGALEIGTVRPADAGSYKCKVQNVEGERFSAVGRLIVDEDPGQCRVFSGLRLAVTFVIHLGKFEILVRKITENFKEPLKIKSNDQVLNLNNLEMFHLFIATYRSEIGCLGGEV